MYTFNAKKALALAVAMDYMINSATAYSTPDAACQFFNSNYGNLTSMPNTTMYTDINTDYWDGAAALGPACIFAPSSAELMSVAVKKLVELDTPFAIKGGGHLAIAGSNNINSTGVLLAASNLDAITIADDRSSVYVGPGNKWGDVMDLLQDSQLSVVGGRMSIVGVPGLLLGGGMSNFGNEYGWAASNILEYECVLADGTIATVTPDGEYSDLFWALRGGGNSFCIATGFTLRALEVPTFTAGQRVFNASEENTEKFIDAVYTMAVNPNPDVKAGLSPVANGQTGQDGVTYRLQMFYNGNDTTPEFFANFSSPVFEPYTDTFAPCAGMGDAATEMSEGTDQIEGFREGWWFITISADKDAIRLFHDTYFDYIDQYLGGNKTELYITGLAFNVISREYVEAGIARGGEDPMGLDPEGAPYIMFEESLTWYSAEDDAAIEAFYEAFNANITTQLEDMGVLSPFVYLNDANGKQDVFAGYPIENVNKLKTIREKYDPDRVYTDLMPGGWKVADWKPSS